jgi:hypothetical protein
VPTLDDVLAGLDSELLRPIGRQAAPTASVGDLVLYDRADTDAVTTGAIVLAIGVDPQSDEAVELLELAHRRHAAAVVFRTDHPLTGPVERSLERISVTVLGLPADLRWEQAHLLLRSALSNAGDAPRPTAAGLPVGDLFALCDAVAASVGGPVLIADPHWKILAYSNLEYELDPTRRDAILGRIAPSEWLRRMNDSGIAGVLRSSDTVVRFEGDGAAPLRPRLVASIRAGEEFLGSLWVQQTDAPFTAATEAELAGAAKLAVVHVLSHRASDDIRRRTRGAFVRELLDGWTPSRSSIDVLQTSGPFTALVFSLDDDSPAPHELSRERMLGIISLHCESRHTDALCALIKDDVWAVLPTFSRDTHDATVDLAARIVERVEASTGARLHAAIGTTVATITDIPLSRRAAEQALAVAKRPATTGRIAHIDDVRSHATLREILDLVADKPELRAGKLEQLSAHDARHGSSYVQTLRTYLDVGGDIPAAAARLGVHRNSVRYRLARIREISKLDLADPDERVVTELQLRLL